MKSKYLKSLIFIVCSSLCLYSSNVYASASCIDSNITKAVRIAGFLLILAKVLVPLIIVFFGTMDFVKAVSTGDDSLIKKYGKFFLIRCVIGIAIFFLPSLILIVSNIMEGSSGSNSIKTFSGCTKCFLGAYDSSNCSGEKQGVDVPVYIPSTKPTTTTTTKSSSNDDDGQGDSTDVTTPSKPSNDGPSQQTTVPVIQPSVSSEAIAAEAERILSDSTWKNRYEYVLPKEYSKRVSGYKNAVLGKDTTYYADCNSFVGAVVKRATGIGADPGNISGLGDYTVAGPSGKDWVVRDQKKDTFEVVAKRLTLKEALSQAQRGDLIASSNGDKKTHIQIYVGNNCVIGNVGGSKPIQKDCNSAIPHKGDYFTIIRLKK